MKQQITPCFWFDENAKEAASFYCSIFPNAKFLQESPIVVTFELNGTKIMGLNGGSKYAVNQAISLYVYCGNNHDIELYYNMLIEGGKILMPLGKYDWSEKYAWVEDAYGINWQLDIDSINSPQKIVPSLLFANNKMGLIKATTAHYTSIFPESKILLESPYPISADLPEGTLLFSQFMLNGFIINAMSSTMKHDFDFTPGNSFMIECETQEEIDYYWNKLGEGGMENMCGWLDDKFGVSWQVIPRVLGELMSKPEKRDRVIDVFLKMRKFDIETLLNA